MKNRRKNKNGKQTFGLTRRQILKAGLIGGGAALFWHGDTLYGWLGGSKVALAQTNPTLNPSTVSKYVTPLLIPPVMPQAGKAVSTGGKNADYYEISVRQFQ